MGDRLYLRGSTWWTQLPVPPDVQHIFKKKNFQTTTRHKDKRNASIAAALIVAGWQKDVNEARIPITFDVTLLRGPYRASGGVFGCYRWLRKRLVVIILFQCLH